MLSAIIVAGGSSRRMGFDKTFAILAGKPVIAHTLAAFEATESVAEIIVVGREERLRDLNEIVEIEGCDKVQHVIAGGTRRQDSVANGLNSLGKKARFVAVQDAARPLVRPADIERVFDAVQRQGAAALAAPVRDTLKRADADHFVIGGIEREDLFAMETPQIFARDLLRRAYELVAKNNVVITDEVSAVEQLKHKVLLVPNDQPNFKITYPADLALAEFVLKQRS
ncbi:MAG TPA: 2-C-methyl-D-erythritol 4-phosphate cytidylyltransferase [Chthoniobacterales bacterium]|jgi:2-C-methyl-D-erythritol 4-phosphate cytidylyltransferase